MGIAQRIGRRRGERQSFRFGKRDQSRRIGQVHGQRLFRIDVLAGLQRHAGNLEMAFGRGEVDDDLDCGVVHHGFSAFVGRHVMEVG